MKGDTILVRVQEVIALLWRSQTVDDYVKMLNFTVDVAISTHEL